MKLMVQILTIVVLALGMSRSYAQGAPLGFSFDGVLLSNTNAPVTQPSVKFKVEILDPSATCVLYSEEHPNLDLSLSNGSFALRVGSKGITGSNRVTGSSFISGPVFENPGTIGSFTGCASGVTLSPNAGRLLRVSYDLGDGNGYLAFNPDFKIDSVPYALVADSIGGKRLPDLVQVRNDSATALNQANLENIFSATNYPRLSALVSGSMPSMSGSRLTNVGAPAVSQDAANKGYVDSFIGGKSIDLSGVGPSVGSGNVLTWDGVGNKWVTMAPNTDGSALTNVNANRIAGRNVAAATPSNDQVLKFNSTTSTWVPAPDIAGISGLTGDVSASGVGAVTASINSGVVTSSKIANGAVTSAKIASGFTVNQLLITDSVTGANVGYASCPNNNDVLKWSTTLGWQCSTPSSLAPVTSVAGKTGVVSLTTNDVSGLGSAATRNVGTAVGNLLEITGSGGLPAIDGGQLSNVSAQRLAGRPVSPNAPTAESILSWNNSAGVWEPSVRPVVWFVPATGEIAAGAAGTERMRVDTSGRVGIGTSFPAESLDVRSGGQAGLRLVSNSGLGSLVLKAPSSGGGAWTFPTSDGAMGQVLATNGAGQLGWTTPSAGGGGGPWTLSGADIYYSGGNVGIGTTSPFALLTVGRVAANNMGDQRGMVSMVSAEATSSGDSTQKISAGNAFLRLTPMTNTTIGYNSLTGGEGAVNIGGSYNGSVNMVSGQRGVILAENGMITNGSGLDGGVEVTATNSFGQVDLAGTRGRVSHNGTGIIATAAGLTGVVNGNGPITSAYGARLSVQGAAGSIQTGYGLFIDSIAGQTRYPLYVSDTTATSYIAGRVGVGTLSPVARLDVAGSIRIGSDNSTCSASIAGVLRMNTGSLELCNGTAWTTLGSGGGGGGLWSASGSDIFYSTGKVGIGTTSAMATLDVNGAISANSIITKSGTVTATSSSGTVTVVGSPLAGMITLSVSTATTSTTSGPLVQVTLPTAPQAPFCVTSVGSMSSAQIANGGAVYVSTQTTGFSISTGIAINLPANQYVWYYQCIGR